ncbi:hypothetical protein HMPREF3217_00862, partial [Finegoldia magna]
PDVRAKQFSDLPLTEITAAIRTICVSQTMRVTTFIPYPRVAANFLVRVLVQNSFLILL